jgi:hypothetical protein
MVVKGIPMIYTAILVACLATSPALMDAGLSSVDCRDHEMLIEAGVSPVSAFLEAQTKAAEWLAQHPGLAQRSLTVKPGRAA